MSLRVGDRVYQRPETIRGGLPRTLDLGRGVEWEVVELRGGDAVLRRPGEKPYVAPSGTLVMPTEAFASVEKLVTAEELMAEELMA